jgi:Polysaccharide pyruvyl transferase
MRMPNILVMSPSGEVYDHDCVRWYSHTDIQRNINHYHNIGDAFVFDSSLKLLNYNKIDALNIRDARRCDIDRYNAEYDYCFLRGSNYIHSEMDWENAIPVLEQLKIPVLAFGIGAQAPSKGKLKLSETTKRVMHLISDHSESIGVRGDYTADVLWEMGIRNTRVVGCPTLFRNNNPDLRIDLPPLDQIRKVAFTLRREVSATYAQDIERYLRLHHDTILEMAARFDLAICAQGEIEEKKILWGSATQKAEAEQQLRDESWFTSADDPMIRLYRERLFYSDVVSDWERLMRGQDLTLGYRLHGNLMALANGVPSVYFTYDSRTAEFVETYRIPSFDVFSGRPFRLEDYWDQSLFERFNRVYRQRYQDMQAFLDENTIDHRMRPQAPRLRAVG